MFAFIATIVGVFLIGWGVLSKLEADHVADPFNLPWPYGKRHRVMMRAYVPNNVNNLIVDRLTIPFNCYVAGIILSHKKFSVVLDSISIVTKDAAKNVLGAVTPADDVDAVAQTVHADVANKAYPIDRGDVLYLKCTSTTANSGGWVNVELDLIPQFGAGR